MKLSTIVGVFFVLVGGVMLANIFFGIALPILQLALAAMFVYAGAMLLVRRGVGEGSATGDTISFGAGELHAEAGAHRPLVVAFGRGTLDLVERQQSGSEVVLRLQVLVGDCVVRFDPELPLCIEATAILGDCKMPDTNRTALGTLVYRTAGHKPGEPSTSIFVTVALGSVRFEPKPGALAMTRVNPASSSMN